MWRRETGARGTIENSPPVLLAGTDLAGTDRSNPTASLGGDARVDTISAVPTARIPNHAQRTRH